MSRAERRREERARAKRRETVLIAGDGIVARGLGQHYEAVPHAQLPSKAPGQHRWIAIAAHVIDIATAATVFDADKVKFMDRENLMSLTVGCYDCERPLSEVAADSYCPAPAAD